MRALVDNNLPPSLACALNCLSGQAESVPVWHLTDKFDRTTADADWIGALAEDGDWIVISQDKFAKGRLEREAFRRSGLTAFILMRAWSGQAFWPKSCNLLRWWPAILDQSRRVHGGAAFLVPWQFSGHGRFRQANL